MRTLAFLTLALAALLGAAACNSGDSAGSPPAPTGPATMPGAEAPPQASASANAAVERGKGLADQYNKRYQGGAGR